jgi:hypothetical protein
MQPVPVVEQGLQKFLSSAVAFNDIFVVVVPVVWIIVVSPVV